MGRPLEPGLLRVYRYSTSIAMLYFAIIWGYAINTPQPSTFLQAQALVNLLINTCLFIYLSIPSLEQRLKRWYLPLALIGYTIATVFSNLIYFIEPNKDLYTVITQSWSLVPILLVPLVLIAWQYSFFYVLVYVIFTNGVELIILVQVVKVLNFETLPVLGLPLIRAFAFGVVGYVVERLMDTQRAQKRKLVKANIRLGQQANTLEQLATSRERNRLARELHDTLAHTLSGLAINLEAIQTMLPPGQEDISTMLDHSLDATRLGLDETRRVLQDLRARPLEDLGLALALQRLVEAADAQTGIAMETKIIADLPTLPPDVEQCLYRIAQESLENIATHSQASHVSLSVDYSGNQLILLIRDDGKGFIPKSVIPDEGRYGIRGMKERAAVVGGNLWIDSDPGRGTTVKFTWERLDDQDLDL